MQERARNNDATRQKEGRSKLKLTTDRLRLALVKRKKSELIEVIAEIASCDRGILRHLEL